jgi:hypothetical protein
MNTQTTQFDQGLERTPVEFRKFCWETVMRAEDGHWGIFKASIMQFRFGGVSSEAEARRLFRAEQIGHKIFLEDVKPSQMAFELSEEIQSSFQNSSRPISVEADPDQEIIEIVNYYFPDAETLQNFEHALEGRLDEAPSQIVSQVVQAPIFESQDIPTFEEDFAFVETPEHSPQDYAKSEIKQSPQITNNLSNERPKLKAYVEAMQKGQNITSQINLPESVKAIVEEHFLE